jgi:hypothetical protein
VKRSPDVRKGSHHIGGPSFIADVLSFLLYNVYGRLLR